MSKAKKEPMDALRNLYEVAPLKEYFPRSMQWRIWANIDAEAVAFIRTCDTLLISNAWLTSDTVVDALRGRRVVAVVHAGPEIFAPKTDHQHAVLASYRALPLFSPWSSTGVLDPLWRGSVLERMQPTDAASLPAVRCAGEPERSESYYASFMHRKTIIGYNKGAPVGVFTGSANASYNTTFSINDMSLMFDPALVQAEQREFWRLYVASARLEDAAHWTSARQRDFVQRPDTLLAAPAAPLHAIAPRAPKKRRAQPKAAPAPKRRSAPTAVTADTDDDSDECDECDDADDADDADDDSDDCDDEAAWDSDNDGGSDYYGSDDGGGGGGGGGGGCRYGDYDSYSDGGGSRMRRAPLGSHGSAAPDEATAPHDSRRVTDDEASEIAAPALALAPAPATRLRWCSEGMVCGCGRNVVDGPAPPSRTAARFYFYDTPHGVDGRLGAACAVCLEEAAPCADCVRLAALRHAWLGERVPADRATCAHAFYGALRAAIAGELGESARQRRRARRPHLRLVVVVSRANAQHCAFTWTTTADIVVGGG